MTSVCNFDSPQLTRSVGGIVPTFLIEPTNTASIAVTGSFTNGCKSDSNFPHDRKANLTDSELCLRISNQVWSSWSEQHYSVSSRTQQSIHDCLCRCRSWRKPSGIGSGIWTGGNYCMVVSKRHLELNGYRNLYLKFC